MMSHLLTSPRSGETIGQSSPNISNLPMTSVPRLEYVEDGTRYTHRCCGEIQLLILGQKMTESTVSSGLLLWLNSKY